MNFTQLTKRISLTILLFHSIYISYAQNTIEIDSLKKIVTDKPTFNNWKLTKRIGQKYYSINQDSTLKYVTKNLTLAKKLKVDSLIAESYNTFGDIYDGQKNTQESLKYYNLALETNKEQNHAKGSSYMGLGNIYSKQNMYYISNDYFLKSATIFENKDIFMFIGIYTNIANNFRKLKDYDSSLKYYNKALEINDNKNSNNIQSNAYLKHLINNNIGDVYNNKGEYQKAITYLKKALNYYSKNNYERQTAYQYFGLGVAYSNLKNKIADYYFKKAFKINEKLHNYYELANTYKAYSEYLINQKEYKKSIIYADRAIELSKKYKAIDFEIIALQNKAIALEKIGSITPSLVLTKKYLLKKDSLYNLRVLTSSKELALKYETEKKEKELLQTKADKATTELKLTNQKQLTYSLFGGLLIFLLLGFSILQRNKRKHQVAIANQKEKNLQTVILAEEKERTRIARELHDGIVQEIGVTILESRKVFEQLGLLNKKETKQLLANFESSNTELRKISHQMMPRALEEVGLITALTELFTTSFSAGNIKHKFENVNISDRLPKNIEITLYRITQELINNILKHSKATDVNIQLYKNDNNIIYMLQDNGTGFSSNKNEGIGLKSIKTRIDLIKGFINFNSENTGMLTTIKIPLK